MQTIETVRSEDDYRTKLQCALDQELSRAAAGLTLAVSTKAAAQFLGVHFDTLGEWRRRSPPLGPPFQKGAGQVGGRANQHVKYLYQDLVDWRQARAGKTAKERRLITEGDTLQQQIKELELELALAEMKAKLAKLKKAAGRTLALATLADCASVTHEWALIDGEIAGHVLTVSDEVLDQALDGGEIWEGTLADALLEPWSSVDARDPFDAALESVLTAYERSRSSARSQDRAHAMESRLPAATGPSTRKPFRF